MPLIDPTQIEVFAFFFAALTLAFLVDDYLNGKNGLPSGGSDD